MIHTLAWGIGCLACLLAVSCEQTDITAATPATDSALQLGVVEKLTQANDAKTRAAAGYEEMTVGDRLGLFRKGETVGTYTYTALRNVPYEYKKADAGATAPEWLPTGGDNNTVWLHLTADANVAACYPYSTALPLVSGKEDAGIVNLTAAIRNASTPQDLWYAHCTANGSDCKKDLQLTQAYCRMQLTLLIDKSATYTSEPYLYYLKIEGGRASATSATDGIFSAATLDLFKDAASAYTLGAKDYTPVNVTANNYQITDNASTTKAAFDLMMIPATLTGAVKLTIKTGGSSGAAKEMSVSIPAADFGGSLSAGKIYKVSVKIKGTDIDEFSSVTTDWSPAVSSGSGTTVNGQKYFDFSSPVF